MQYRNITSEQQTWRPVADPTVHPAVPASTRLWEVCQLCEPSNQPGEDIPTSPNTKYQEEASTPSPYQDTTNTTKESTIKAANRQTSVANYWLLSSYQMFPSHCSQFCCQTLLQFSCQPESIPSHTQRPKKIPLRDFFYDIRGLELLCLVSHIMFLVICDSKFCSNISSFFSDLLDPLFLYYIVECL